MCVCVPVYVQRLELKLEYEYQVLALSGGSEDGSGLFFRQGHHTLSSTFTIKHTHTHTNTLTQSHTDTNVCWRVYLRNWNATANISAFKQTFNVNVTTNAGVGEFKNLFEPWLTEWLIVES